MEPAGPARTERRLAAILAADVAGYSRLIEADEEGTLNRLKALRAEAQIAIATLFERFPSLQLDPEHAVEHKRAPVFNGLEALWVRAADKRIAFVRDEFDLPA